MSACARDEGARHNTGRRVASAGPNPEHTRTCSSFPWHSTEETNSHNTTSTISAQAAIINKRLNHVKQTPKQQTRAQARITVRFQKIGSEITISRFRHYTSKAVHFFL